MIEALGTYEVHARKSISVSAHRHRTSEPGAVRAHFSEVEIVETAWVNAAENYYNLQAPASASARTHNAADDGVRPKPTSRGSVPRA